MKIIKWLCQIVKLNLSPISFLIAMSIAGYFLKNTLNGLLAGVLVICIIIMISKLNFGED